jgi:hypothetical protein
MVAGFSWPVPFHTGPQWICRGQVCPVPVGVGDPGGLAGHEGDAVGVLAAVTASGSIELITLHRGMLSPLTATVSVSLSANPAPRKSEYPVWLFGVVGFSLSISMCADVVAPPCLWEDEHHTSFCCSRAFAQVIRGIWQTCELGHTFPSRMRFPFNTCMLASLPRSSSTAIFIKGWISPSVLRTWTIKCAINVC